MAKPNRKYGRDFWMFKAPMELKKELDRIRLERIKKGRDKEIKSYSRLGLAISRHAKLMDDLVKANLEDEKNVKE